MTKNKNQYRLSQFVPSNPRNDRKRLLKELKNLYSSKSTEFHNVDRNGLSESEGYLTFK